MKITPFKALAGKKERKKEKKKNKERKKVCKMQSHHGIHCNFLQQQKLSVQQHYHQSLPINSKEEMQTVIDCLYFLFCCH
jgi:hypothetical protein